MTKGYTINVLDHGFVRYVDHMGTDMDIVGAARVSYNSESKGEQKDKGLLEYLWKNKHTSPFEMCKLKIDVKLPIFIARQWIRHRMQNINEVSARYTELPGEFYIPTKWRKNLDKGKNKQQSEISEELDHEGLTKKVECFCEESYNQYKSLLENGVAKELARMVLPLNIYTQWISCWDLKNLLHFITLRDDAHAQAEIQEYSKAIKLILKELFPWTMEVYEKYKFVLQENKI
jgi:thymidylate synthase (FAD)